jgi:hypothetical protein
MNSSENHHPEEGELPPPPESAQPDLRDFLGGLLLLILSVAFTIAALRIPFHNASWEWYTSPGIFALAMAICLGLCSLVVGVRGLRGWLRKRPAAEPNDWREGLRRWGMGRFLAALAIILVYLLLLGRVPFLLASVGLILVLGTTFREGPFLSALRPAIIAAVIIVLFSYVFMKVFGIVYP